MKVSTAVLFPALVCVGTTSQAAVIASGSGSVAANRGGGPTMGFAANASQAIAVADFSVTGDLAAGDTISITGSMTLSNSINFNDRVVLGISGDGNTFPSNPFVTNSNFALYAESSVANAATAPFTIATDGNVLASGTHGSAADADNRVDYAINITFPANFEDGGTSGSYAYAFELGLDFDSDGTFDDIQNGIFLVDSGTQAKDRFRFGFGAIQSGNRPTAENLTNSFTFEISDAPVTIIPEPGSLTLAGIGCGLLLARRRK